MLQTFEFKPAPLARPVRVEVDDVGATIVDSKGKVHGRLEFASARAARFAELSARGVTSRWFDVEHAQGRFRMKCNSNRGDDPTKGHLAQYRAATQAILAGLEARAPGVQVDLGIGDGARRAMFAIGACALIAGIGLPVAGLAMGVSSSKVLSGLVPSAFLLLIGGVLSATYRPGQPATLVPLAALREALGE